MIKVLLASQVMSADELCLILDFPKLREHLKERHAAIAGLVPTLQKWIKSAERKRQLSRQRQAINRRTEAVPPPSRAYPESPRTWNDPRLVRNLSDE